MLLRLQSRKKALIVMIGTTAIFTGLLWTWLCQSRPTGSPTIPPRVLGAADRPDYSAVLLSQSPYLRDVIEPIVMIGSHGVDDGGSIGIVFRDSKGNEKAITLLDNLDGEHNLVFADYFADPTLRRVPLAGNEEKALMGLLERWYRQDPDAVKWNDLIEKWLSLGRGPIKGANEIWGEPLAKLRAVCILRALASRN
jgi:hypothetical protein